MRRLVLMFLMAVMPGWADEIHLRGGGKLRGEIETENEREIVLAMPSGTMVVSRKRIARIVREKRDDYLRREAESRLRSGSTARAVDLYERALRLDPGDSATRAALAKALAQHVRAQLARFRLDAARTGVGRLAELAPGAPLLASLRAEVEREERRTLELKRRADSLFAKGEFAAGLQALDAWRLRQPPRDAAAERTLGRAHEQAGIDAARQGQLRAALDHFRAARSFGARRHSVRALDLLRPIAVLEALKEGRGEEARGIIRSLGVGYPQPGVARFLEAVADQLEGDMVNAVAGYAEAQRLATLRKGGKNAEGVPYKTVRVYAASTLRAAITHPPREGARHWHATFVAPLKSARRGIFTVHAATEEMAEQVAATASAVYDAASLELLGRRPSVARAQIVIHSGRETYIAADANPQGTPIGSLTAVRESSNGMTYRTLDERGKALLRIESYGGQSILFDTVLPHEVIHVVQHLGVKAFRRAHWLDEGLAMLWERESAHKRRLAWLRRSETLFSLKELTSLRSTPPERAFVYYNQAFALCAYMRGLGTARDWSTFLDRFARQDLARAVRDTWGVQSIDELERGFLAETNLKR